MLTIGYSSILDLARAKPKPESTTTARSLASNTSTSQDPRYPDAEYTNSFKTWKRKVWLQVGTSHLGTRARHSVTAVLRSPQKGASGAGWPASLQGRICKLEDWHYTMFLTFLRTTMCKATKKCLNFAEWLGSIAYDFWTWLEILFHGFELIARIGPRSL